MADRLLEPERLTTLLSSLAGRRAERRPPSIGALPPWRAKPRKPTRGCDAFTSSSRTVATMSMTS
jgi:hypothetical protein